MRVPWAIMGGVNKIRDRIEVAIEITRDSKVPILLMANPGLAKSTVVYNWARRNGYHIETLIGSRFSQEEILGFQVRAEDRETGEHYLELLAPHWYRNILDQENNFHVPSVLFLDELSTAQENVQGALLQLVFERKIGNGRTLPESTLVIAAANYKQNIPFQFNIMAPILNRFCIINLSYESNDSFLDEFLQDEADLAKDPVVFAEKEITPWQKSYLRDGLKMMFRTLFRSFEEDNRDMDKDLFYTMDINNQVYNTMYDDDSRYVYNFISGRTLWYLYKISLSFLRKGLTMEIHGAAILNMVYGLIGLGTNTFTEKQRKAYLKSAETLYRRLYDVLSSRSDAGTPAAGGEVQSASLDFRGKSVADAVNEWVLFHESSVLHDTNDPNLEALAIHIGASYGINAEDTERLRQKITHNKADLYTFSNDMQRLDYLIGILVEETKDKNSKTDPLGRLCGIRDVYAELRDEAVKLMMKNTG
ncbi:AAA family ATPase [Treponema primitia]|uniref:AAA family ATPase n=1 Tax=Treponema primitia TaxID=88058 RepID=UPI00397F9F48